MSLIERVSNREIARLLRGVAAAYAVRGGETFRQTADQKAAEAIDHLGSDLRQT